MTQLALILGIVAVPALVLTFLRINAVLVLLSLCLGDVLARFASGDAGSLVGMFSANTITTNVSASLLLLLAPPIIIAVVMIGTVRGKFRTLFNLVPAIAVGSIGLLLAEPLLSPGLRGSIQSNAAWHDLQIFQALIVSLAAAMSLVLLALQRPAHNGRSGKHHGHH